MPHNNPKIKIDWVPGKFDPPWEYKLTLNGGTQTLTHKELNDLREEVITALQVGYSMTELHSSGKYDSRSIAEQWDKENSNE